MTIDARRSGIDIANDALLQLTGPSTGNAIEAANVTADADGSRGYKYVGQYRAGYIELRLTGSFDRTTGDENVVGEVWEATDAAGTGAVLIASGVAQTATHAANLGTATANGKAAGTLSTGPARIGFQTGSGGYIKYRSEVGTSTTPIVGGVSADVVMTSVAFRPSGT
jgi:hypothetical protein